MISERKFSASHSGFWRQILPFAETYIRRANLLSEQRVRSVFLTSSTDRRSLVGELAFRTFCQAIEAGALTPISEPTTSTLSDTLRYLSRFEDWPLDAEPPTAPEINEAVSLARRLGQIFSSQGWTSSVVPRPKFRGCGFIDDCEGDIAVGRVLVEVKAVDRAWRIADFRQVLTYLALAWANREPIGDIALCNPRRGRLYRTSVETACMELSGRSEVDLFDEIISYVSIEEGSH